MKKTNKAADFILDQMGINVMGEEAPAQNSEQLKEIRRISNVIQALENLINQCEEGEAFAHIREYSLQALGYSHQQLRRQIHL